LIAPKKSSALVARIKEHERGKPIRAHSEHACWGTTQHFKGMVKKRKDSPREKLCTGKRGRAKGPSLCEDERGSQGVDQKTSLPERIHRGKKGERFGEPSGLKGKSLPFRNELPLEETNAVSRIVSVHS